MEFSAALLCFFHRLAQAVEHFVVARQLPLREAVDRAALLRVQAHLQLGIEPFALFLRCAADFFALFRAELCRLTKLCQLLRAPFADALAALLRSKAELFGKLSTLLLQEHCVLGKNRVRAEKPLHGHDEVGYNIDK